MCEQITFLSKRALRHSFAIQFYFVRGCLLTLSCELVFIIPHRGPMAKKVTLADGSVEGEKDGIASDDDLSLERYSDEESGGRTDGSEAVSEYEGNPKEAPRYAFFGEDRCRAKFKLKEDRHIIRVCGGSMDCSRKHHKKSPDRGLPGVYDTIKTRIYVDGILHTYRTTSEQEASDVEYKKLVNEATEQLTGSRTYREQLQAAEAELEEGGNGHDSSNGTPESGVHVNIDGWNFDSDDEGVATGARKSARISVKNVASLKPADQGDTETQASIKKGRKKVTLPPDGGASTSNRLAEEVRDALTTMTEMMATMATLIQDRSKQQARQRTVDDSDDSSEEEEPPKSGGRKPPERSRIGKKDPPKSSPTRKDRRYYAVARGRKPGVYTDWGQAERQVNGFSGALHKKFKTRAEAQRFVDKYKARNRAESEDESEGPPTDSNGPSSDEERPRKRDGPRRKTEDRARSEDESKLFPPLEIAAPDPSAGNAKEFFKMTIAGEEQMAAKMSPPGLDNRTIQDLANATLDAIQLPGTSMTENLDGTGELVGALRDMAEDRRYEWAEDRPQKDSLWRTAGRTSILSIKTAEGLQERVGEFAGISEEMFETQVHRFRSIFSRLHWSEGMIHAWATSNWFLRIGKDTLDHYVALHLHLFALANTEGWPYAQEALKHYGTKLIQFRRTNTSRLVCLVKIYIFLRDARKSDFHSAKLQEKRNHAMLAKISTLETGGGGGSGGSSRATCKKCGLDPHPGGVKKCWFRSLSDVEAKKRASQLMTKLGKMNTDEIATFLGVGASNGEE